MEEDCCSDGDGGAEQVARDFDRSCKATIHHYTPSIMEFIQHTSDTMLAN